MDIIERAPLDQEGEPNPYHSETFISSLAKYFLPQAALWSSMMLGQLKLYFSLNATNYLFQNIYGFKASITLHFAMTILQYMGLIVMKKKM